MKCKVLLLSIFLLAQAANAIYAQTISLNGNNLSVEKYFESIQKQTGYTFLYNDKVIKNIDKKSIIISDVTLEKALSVILGNSNLKYSIEGKTIVIGVDNAGKDPDNIKDVKDGNSSSVKSNTQGSSVYERITGNVKNDNGEPIEGASVAIVGTKRGTTTDAKGDFIILNVPTSAFEVLVTSVGYKGYQAKTEAGEYLKITLARAENIEENVIVNTGMFKRNKYTYSGAVATFTGEDLKKIGNQNILQSLRSLDPSFIIKENNLTGSDPNSLPQIEVRGQSSLGGATLKDVFNDDPNMPLFILDGFVVPLRTIYDLDINRIATLTILKDAASAAIYGSKAANGVVVIETKIPEPGKLRLSLVTDMSLDVPDLRDYNMMNASEELEFERLAGRYDFKGTFSDTYIDWDAQYKLDQQYAARKALVEKGVNTYWLNEPLHLGFTQGYSLNADGGDNAVRYSIGGNYKNLAGVMKGSDRTNYGANFKFIYRVGKINISNNFNFTGSTADNSPYGSFRNYVNAPAYYPKYPEDGIMRRYLDQTINMYDSSVAITNPLYNALLHQINNTKYIGFTNNLGIIYTLSNSLRLEGALSVSQLTNESVNFTPPENTRFDSRVFSEKGEYVNSNTKSSNYQGYLQVVYGKVFNKVHQLNANLRSEIEQSTNDFISFTAVGFPPGSTGNPAFAMGYLESSKPSSSKVINRRNNAVLSVSYAFDRRFFTDLSIRYDGSTAFGRNEKYTNFWAIGGGWNVNREKFMAKVNWVDILRLRANIGTNGNQGFGSLTSVATYNYNSDINLFGMGLDLATVANPNLQWQKTKQINLGLDMTLFQTRLNFTGNVYNKYSSPLIVIVPLPTSTGLSGYPLNAGAIDTKGLDINVSYAVVYQPKNRLIWRIGATAGAFSSKYEKFNNTLIELNKLNQLNNSLERYYDGFSPNDVWAIKSLGIDPASGREIFLRKDGEYTFDYSAEDIVKVGNSQPTIEGVVNTNFSYKGFFINAALRYSFGAYVLNSALFNKVENISWSSINQNQDRRALTERWKQPGDQAQFKGINLIYKDGAGGTFMSSRFLQKDNYFSGESISVGYDFDGYAWVKLLKMQYLRIQLYTNNVFRISTILRERGLDYPYSNTFSFSLRAGF